MIVEYKLKPNQKLTKKQKEEIDKASKMPVVFDEDSPELTSEELDEMRRIAVAQREARKREPISLRIDQESIRIAKSFGDGYTSLMSRILYKALRDPEYIKDCL